MLSQWYLDEDRTLLLPLPDPLNPVLAITLRPNWLYPFPQNATLISGRVLDGGGAAIPDARVQLLTLEEKQIENGTSGDGRFVPDEADPTQKGQPVENRTSADGRFILYVTGLVEDDVQASARDPVLLASSGETSFLLKTTHAGFQTKNTTIKNVKEGETHFRAVPITLQKT